MKIAAAAYPIDWHNRWNEFVGKLRVWVRTAAENGAELLVFPEYAAFELASLAREENAKDLRRAIEAVSARIKDVDELHGSLAREFNLHICAASGLMHDVGGKTVNRARLFTPDGGFGAQDKQVLSPMESGAGISAGTGGRVFETRLGRIGVLPGRDALLPPLARAMAAAGAEILLVPVSLTSTRGYWRARTAAMARAMESQCVVAQAVTVGGADWLATATKSVGAAGIFAPPEEGLPEDGVIAAGKMNAAGWVYGEVDPSLLRAARQARAARDPAFWDDLTREPGTVETVLLGKVDAETA